MSASTLGQDAQSQLDHNGPRSLLSHHGTDTCRTRTKFLCDSKVSPILSGGQLSSLEVHKNNRTKVLRDLNVQLARMYTKMQQVGSRERDSKFLEQEVEVIRGNCLRYSIALSVYLMAAAESNEWLDMENNELRGCYATFFITVFKVAQAFEKWQSLKCIVPDHGHNKTSSIFSISRSSVSLDERLGLYKGTESLESDIRQLENILKEARPALANDFEQNLFTEEELLETYAGRRQKLLSLCCLSCVL